MPEIPEDLPEGIFVKNGRLIVNVELDLDDPKDSTSGKTKLAFTTHGFLKPSYDSPVDVSINATMPK